MDRLYEILGLKPINYNKLYQEKYRRYPDYMFFTVFFSLVLGFLIGGVALLCSAFDTDDFFLGFLGVVIIIAGFFIAVLVAYFVRTLWAIRMSQKVVITDAVLAIKREVLKNAEDAEDKQNKRTINAHGDATDDSFREKKKEKCQEPSATHDSQENSFFKRKTCSWCGWEQFGSKRMCENCNRPLD